MGGGATKEDEQHRKEEEQKGVYVTRVSRTDKLKPWIARGANYVSLLSCLPAKRLG